MESLTPIDALQVNVRKVKMKSPIFNVNTCVTIEFDEEQQSKGEMRQCIRGWGGRHRRTHA